MGRILALDYGQKKVGVAVTDECRICAQGLETVHVSEIFDYLKQYVEKNQVDMIIIGEPKQMNNDASDSERFITPFINRIKKQFTTPVFRFDERFTSKMAFQTMLDAGLGKKARRNKALVDTISATLILQSFLESSMYQNMNPKS